MFSSPPLTFPPYSFLFHLTPPLWIQPVKSLVRHGGGLKVVGQQKPGSSFAPLPKTVHKKLVEENLKDGRLILIGDIHGCVDELLDLLKLTGFQKNDNVILLGDLVNKGPNSLEVVRLSQEMGFHAVRGNHDDLILKSFKPSKTMKYNEKLKWIKDMTKDDFLWLKNLPLSLHIPSHNALIIHGGLLPDVDLSNQSPHNLLNLRFIRPNRFLSTEEISLENNYSNHSVSIKKLKIKRASKWEICSEGDSHSMLWAKNWVGPPHVFFGHDAARGLQLYEFATGLDTGCVYGGYLTACILPPIAKLKTNKSLRVDRHPFEVDKPLGGTLVAVPARRQYCQVKTSHQQEQPWVDDLRRFPNESVTSYLGN